MSQPVIHKLRLSSPGDLVEAVPYLLGFHPEDSLVALALRGRRRRLAFTMRIDLPDPGADMAHLADDIADCLARAGAEQAAFVVVGNTAAGYTGRPHDALIEAVAHALPERQIELTEAVYSGAGRWWSYTCGNPVCCPVEGIPTAAHGTSRVAAAATYAGLVALPSREALEQSLEPIGDAAQAMRPALISAVRAAARAAEPAERAAIRSGSIASIMAAIDDEPALSDEAAARLIVSLADVGVRDACCQWSQTPRSASARRLWTQLARRAAAPFDSAPLCLLAWFAYLDGDATLAAMAVGRCLRSEPDHRLAVLLQEALHRGIDPLVLRRDLAALGEDRADGSSLTG